MFKINGANDYSAKEIAISSKVNIDKSLNKYKAKIICVVFYVYVTI